MTNIIKAIEILNQDGIVIFPTDTAYGIGCRMDNITAVRRLFDIRRRPDIQAAPVLVDSANMAQKYMSCSFPADVLNLTEKYWPGGLTLVYPCKTSLVPDLVRGGSDKLGVRMPDHEIPLALIKGCGVPILGPSANFHGEKTPYKYEELNPELIKLADYVLEGECKTGLASTVLDCSLNPWKVLRQGGVKLDMQNAN